MRFASWSLCALSAIGSIGCQAENQTTFTSADEQVDALQPVAKHGPGGWGWGWGPPGPAGPQGEMGPQGLQGAPGQDGAPGQEGAEGPAGNNGATGAPGAMGLTGTMGATGLTGAPGADGAQGPQGLAGPPGADGAEGDMGPEGPPGILDHVSVDLASDYSFTGVQLSNMFISTVTAADLDPLMTSEGAIVESFLEGGTYLLTWYSEVMRIATGETIFARMRDNTLNETLGLYRLGGTAVWNGVVGPMPTDTNPFDNGSIVPFSGSKVMTLPAGTHTFSLEYGMPLNDRGTMAMRVRRQRLTLLRLD